MKIFIKYLAWKKIPTLIKNCSKKKNNNGKHFSGIKNKVLRRKLILLILHCENWWIYWLICVIFTCNSVNFLFERKQLQTPEKNQYIVCFEPLFNFLDFPGKKMCGKIYWIIILWSIVKIKEKFMDKSFVNEIKINIILVYSRNYICSRKSSM